MNRFMLALLLAPCLAWGNASEITWTPGTPGTGATITGYELSLDNRVVHTAAPGDTRYVHRPAPGERVAAGSVWTARTVDSTGAKSTPVTMTQTFETYTSLPTYPLGVKLTVVGPQITISWQPVEGATGYNVLLDGKVIATVKGTSSLRTVPVGKCVTPNNFYAVQVAGSTEVSPAVSVTGNVCNVPGC